MTLSPPTNLAAVIVNNGVALTWTGIGGATGYVLDRATGTQNGSMRSVPLSGTAYTDTDVAANTTYTYTVRAVGAATLITDDQDRVITDDQDQAWTIDDATTSAASSAVEIVTPPPPNGAPVVSAPVVLRYRPRFRPRLQLAVYDRRGGRQIDDWSDARSVTATCNTHGPKHLQGDLERRAQDLLRFATPGAPPWVQLNDGARAWWGGRLENPRLQNTTLATVAYGAWAALQDDVHTVLYGEMGVANWRIATPDLLDFRLPDQFAFDTNNRLYSAVRRGATLPPGRCGTHLYQLPHRSHRQAQRFTCAYTMRLPPHLALRIVAYAEGGTTAAPLHTIQGVLSGNGTPTIVGGTIDVPVPQRAWIAVDLCNTSTTTSWTWPIDDTGNPIGEEGDYYINVTQPRITSFGGPVTADLIARDLVAQVTARNPSFISTSTLGIAVGQYPERDQAVYADQTAAAILEDQAKLGDAEGVPLTVGVDAEGRVFVRRAPGVGLQGLRIPDTTHMWYVDAPQDWAVEHALDAALTHAYATYQDDAGRTLRTADAVDIAAQHRVGMVRRRAVDARTTSLRDAEYQRDRFLRDEQHDAQRATITASILYDAYGTPHPPWAVQPHDQIIVRNLPPALAPATSALRSFFVDEVALDLDAGTVTLSPSAPIDSLATLLVRRAVGINDR